MQFNQINFEPLVPIDKYTLGLAKKTFGQFLRQPKVLSVFVVLIAALFAPAKIKFILLWLAGVGIFIFMFIYSREEDKTIKSAWQNFADANKWMVVPADISVVPPSLLGVGKDQKQGDIINAQFDGLNCDLFNFEYMLGSGRSSQDKQFLVARIRLNKSFPHIILNSKKMLRGLDKLGGYEQLKLEGDFDKYFSMYISKGEEIDALSIIGPNNMQTIINNNQTQDIEIIEFNLFFISANDRSINLRSGDFKAFLQSVGGLSKEIILRSQSLDYHPVV